MAIKEIRRQFRVTGRAWRKMVRRDIKPYVAFGIFLRSGKRILRALATFTLLVIGGGIFATLFVSTRLICKLRRSGDRAG